MGARDGYTIVILLLVFLVGCHNTVIVTITARDSKCDAPEIKKLPEKQK